MPAGRPKGSSTKNKEFLLGRLQDMYGKDFHPIIKMAKNAVVLQDIADKAVKTPIIDLNAKEGKIIITASSAAVEAINAWDKIAAYTEPKLKALEIDAYIGDAREVHELTNQELSDIATGSSK